MRARAEPRPANVLAENRRPSAVSTSRQHWYFQMPLPTVRRLPGIVSTLILLTGCQGFSLGKVSPSYGGPPPGAPAVRFSPDVVNRTSAFASAFTPDGKTIFFTASDSARAYIDLMMSSFVDGQWTTPVHAPFAEGHKAMDPFVTRDGRQVYFSWAKPVPGAKPDTVLDYDTWVAERVGDGWGEARHVGVPPKTPESDMYPSLTSDGTLYFDSFRPHPDLKARRNVWKSRFVNGAYLPAEPVRVINQGGASNPYIDPDERFIIFSSGRPGGLGGGDLYIAYRDGDSWSEPVSLGSRVNSAATEFCPMVSPDGRYLFFSRIPRANGVAQSNEIWVVGIDVLPRG